MATVDAGLLLAEHVTARRGASTKRKTRQDQEVRLTRSAATATSNEASAAQLPLAAPSNTELTPKDSPLMEVTIRGDGARNTADSSSWANRSKASAAKRQGIECARVPRKAAGVAPMTRGQVVLREEAARGGALRRAASTHSLISGTRSTGQPSKYASSDTAPSAPTGDLIMFSPAGKVSRAPRPVAARKPGTPVASSTRAVPNNVFDDLEPPPPPPPPPPDDEGGFSHVPPAVLPAPHAPRADARERAVSTSPAAPALTARPARPSASPQKGAAAGPTPRRSPRLESCASEKKSSGRKVTAQEPESRRRLHIRRSREKGGATPKVGSATSKVGSATPKRPASVQPPASPPAASPANLAAVPPLPRESPTRAPQQQPLASASPKRPSHEIEPVPLSGPVAKRTRSSREHERAAAVAPLAASSSSGLAEGSSGSARPLERRGAELGSLMGDVRSAYAAFLAAAQTEGVMRTFDALLAQTGVPADAGAEMPASLAAALDGKLTFTQRSLLSKLQARQSRPQYKTTATPLRVLVVGGGPIGLRCAIEQALLGHDVRLVERRADFCRLNVLHLWDWVETDLIDLGVKILDPSVFASADFSHVGTAQLQHSLLKVGLLLGVRVHLGAALTDLPSLRRLVLDDASARCGAPTGHPSAAGGSPAGAANDAGFDVLVDATGARCPMFEAVGFEQQTVLKSARALGLVCHFHNGRTPAETRLEESNWAQQFHTAKFRALKAERGVDLQNIVYYRSTGAFSPAATHYFVMTAESDSLLAAGALIAPDPADGLCSAPNVRKDRLAAYARAAVGAFVPQLAAAELVPGQLQIFDFSERKQSNKASALLSAGAFGGDPAAQVLVTRVGDALQEPFWPEGLGINRGFLHVLDCADLTQGYAALLARHGRLGGSAAPTAERVAECERLVFRREKLFQCVKRVSGSNRLTELKRGAWQIDPAQRYVALPADIPRPQY